jgi:hypothetical protein
MFRVSPAYLFANLLTVACLLGWTPQAKGGAIDMVVISFNSEVIRANFETGDIVYQVQNNERGVGGLAKSNDGRLLAIKSGSANGSIASLLEIDPDTGLANTLVSSDLGPQSSFATTITLDGRLINAGPLESQLSLSFVDLLTLDTTPLNVSYSNNPFSTGWGGMATAPDGSIYGWATGAILDQGVFSNYSTLYQIDVTTNTATAIGMTNDTTVNFNSLAFAPDGQLYGFTEISGGVNGGPLLPNSVYSINTSTGAYTYIKTMDILMGMRGVEFVASAVPEPNSFLLMIPALYFLRRARNQGGRFSRR